MSGEQNRPIEILSRAKADVAAIEHTVRFIIGSLDIGGAEKHLSMVLPRLASAEFMPVVITLTHKGELAAQLESAGIKVYEPPAILRRLQNVTLFRLLFGPFSRILYLIYMYQKVPASLSCFYLPVAYYLGGLTALLTGEAGHTVMFRRSLNRYQLGNPVFPYIEKFLHKYQRAIVGNSRAVIQELNQKEGVSEDKLTLIYNGINISEFGHRGYRDKLRKQLGLDDDVLVMCMVANLIPYKGHADLIDALAGIKDSIDKKWCLLCVGNGIDMRGDLTSKVKSAGLERNIKWLGIRHDIPQILSTADIGLLVSHHEGFSNSLLEGMASGLAMIVTDVGGNSEAVEHQKSGLVVKPHDPQGLGLAVLTLINDVEQRAQYGIAARQRVQQYFSIEACVENYRLFFDRVINE